MIHMKQRILLEDKLIEYSNSDYYGFHMPGHKRNTDVFGTHLPYGMDITEIEGFDDLHHAEDILLDARKRAAEVFCASESFYLINGSTAGNISAILAVTNYGDKILIARNNHKSVYNAAFLNHLNPIYVYPEYEEEYGINGVIKPDAVKDILNNEEGIKAVVIVSPTYDGVVSDVEQIAKIVHEYGIPLIVDEAHGAHFGMNDYFPMNGNQRGADLVIHSVHKTLPSLTQTGLIHVNGPFVNREKLKRYLKMIQSSSPSYILMASIDKCVDILETQGDVLFNKYVSYLQVARSVLGKLKKLQLIETDTFDKSKIIISTKGANISSKELYDVLLEEYHLQMEMCGATYVTAMTSIGDSEEGFERLVQAIQEIDERLGSESKSYNKIEKNDDENSCYMKLGKLPHLRQAESWEEEKEDVVVSEWFYYLYPPGIPMVVPGEIITEEIEQLMHVYEENGFVIQRG